MTLLLCSKLEENQVLQTKLAVLQQRQNSLVVNMNNCEVVPSLPTQQTFAPMSHPNPIQGFMSQPQQAQEQTPQ